MHSKKLLKGYALAFLIVAGCLAPGCAAGPEVTTGPFTEVDRLGSELERGVSTKMNVQKVLGTPKGYGGSLMPGETEPREVWYYDDIELTDFHSQGGGLYTMDVRQQILLVFFKKEAFDGFMWYSTQPARVRPH